MAISLPFHRAFSRLTRDDRLSDAHFELCERMRYLVFPEEYESVVSGMLWCLKYTRRMQERWGEC
jgi:hypothetical protein